MAAVVCIIGSCLSVLLTRRLIDASGPRKNFQLVLTSMIVGATIWSTHFIAMLAYDPGVNHGYEPIRTGLSLAIAVLGTLAANTIFISGRKGPSVLLGGGCFGLTVSAMHYVGMSAYQLPGALVWNVPTLVASIVFGTLLGTATYHRIAHLCTKYCRVSAAVLMVLAICVMHFTGMGAIEIQLSPLREVPPQVISDANLGFLIVFVTGIVFLIGFVAVSIETDIENEAQGKLLHAAQHDPLTGLPNRMALSQKTAEISSRMERDETDRVAVLTIDLKHFKTVNDLHGHAVGDIVLTTIATRLAATLQGDEFVTRTGGDEFIALKRDFRRIDQVVAFAERLHAVIIEPIDTQYATVKVGAAIGIATSLKDGRDLPELLKKSGQSMYRAKVEPDRKICIFNAVIDQQSTDKLLLTGDLRNATERGEFELAYQLQNEMGSLEPIGFEALLRWNHPTRGRIPPDQFIPLAEESGLMREIGLWVLRTACKEAASWRVDYSIAVNVAPQQLVQPSFVEHVSDALIESGLNAERLELEVTEASIIDDQAHTLKVMHMLKHMGVRIAMDDFGTGYSSLATLQAFPFDKIKIDRSFVREVHKNHQKAAIVRSTLLLGDALGIPVLAEGVEDQNELDFLRAEKCSSVQGFYFGRPMSRKDVRKLINDMKKRQAS